jgi:hypothetical protein
MYIEPLLGPTNEVSSNRKNYEASTHALQQFQPNPILYWPNRLFCSIKNNYTISPLNIFRRMRFNNITFFIYLFVDPIVIGTKILWQLMP